MNISIPKEVERALNILHENAFDAYIVGGCVRDSIMGISPWDWDITTSAKPEEIILSFQGYRTIETGIKHGTITVIINKMQIEITTYRIDGKYSDNRHPDDVSFTDNIGLDLKRRDFTINALAYNGTDAIDLFGGISDIKDKIIRCVGEADERFNEDGLRILRALRFASVLNFEIEENTSDSIHKNKDLLNNISMERINTEFSKLLMGFNFQNIIIKYRNVIEVFLPEIDKFSHEELKYRLSSMNNLNSLILKLSLLLYKIEKPDTILIRLKYDNFTINSVKLLLANIDLNIIPDFPNIRKLLRDMDYINLCNLIQVKKILFESQYDGLIKSEKIAKEIIETNQCYSLKSLAINGRDLIEAGIPKGKKIGMILDDVLDKVIENSLENEKDILCSYIKTHYI